MKGIDWLGLAAGACTTLAFVPQVARVWTTRSARDLSLLWIVTFTTGVVLWLVYGICLDSLPVILANAVTLALVLVLLGCKIRFR